MDSRRTFIIILAAVAVIAIIIRLPMRAAAPASTATTSRAAFTPTAEASQSHATSTSTATASAGDEATTPPTPSALTERPIIPAGSGEPMDITGVDTSSADAVADAVAGQASTADVRTDTSWADGARRAVPLMTDELAQHESAEIPGGRDAQWLDLEAHDGYTTVQVEAGADSATPPDTTTQAMRIRLVTVTLLGRDGWEGPTHTTAYYLTLTMTDEGWRVSEMTTSTY